MGGGGRQDEKSESKNSLVTRVNPWPKHKDRSAMVTNHLTGGTSSPRFVLKFIKMVDPYHLGESPAVA